MGSVGECEGYGEDREESMRRYRKHFSAAFYKSYKNGTWFAPVGLQIHSSPPAL